MPEKKRKSGREFINFATECMREPGTSAAEPVAGCLKSSPPVSLLSIGILPPQPGPTGLAQVRKVRRLVRLSQAAQAFAEEKKFSDLLSPSLGLHGPLLVVF